MASIVNRWSVLIISGIVMIGAGFQLLPMNVVRTGALLALLVQIFQERRTETNQFLTSPLFLLGTVTLVFFSFSMGLFDTSFPGGHMKNIESFYGSDAERVMVIFGLSCIAAHSLVVGGSSGFSKINKTSEPRDQRYVYIFSAIAVIVSLASIGNFLSSRYGGPSVTAIRSVAPPLLAFCLIYLVYQSLEASGRQKALIATVVLLSLASLFFIQEGKKPIFMIFAGLLYGLRVKDASLKKLIVMGLVFVLAGIVLLQITMMIRTPNNSMLRTIGRNATPALMFRHVLAAKFVLRQTETRFCLHNVIAEHWDQPFSGTRQLFWLKGLVPRGLWPAKPNLSLGREYAPKYCAITGTSPHSSSITLLGQPIIYGGWVGLLVHGGILIGLLGGAGWLSRHPRSLSTMAVAALLPWLIDFDQDYVLYVANAVKFFLVILPLIFLVTRFHKYRAPA